MKYRFKFIIILFLFLSSKNVYVFQYVEKFHSGGALININTYTYVLMVWPFKTMRTGNLQKYIDLLN
ncbi:MAG: hypothetical protein CVU52_11865 [Deltaproteobacteria bacterium HGW-Deltaproteobacteria-10]|nr:MAG: hypothetical protein CVU62_09075 [Deltaproteobacteria bacterium HGW-Deltaproteobacteria-2]PKN63824.1 MAG: hypothetical protein CVU52_11865 [Deltaproteobacteria bacterium HGW-Deltaproteobacteria-10]